MGRLRRTSWGGPSNHGACNRIDAEAVMFPQALQELFQWLERTMKISSKAYLKLKANTVVLRAMRTRPTLAKAQANVAALQDVLHMTSSHVRTATCERDRAPRGLIAGARINVVARLHPRRYTFRNSERPQHVFCKPS